MMLVTLTGLAMAAPADPFDGQPALLQLREEAMDIALAPASDIEPRLLEAARLGVSLEEIHALLEESRLPPEQIVAARWGELPAEGGGCELTAAEQVWVHRQGHCIEGRADGLGVADLEASGAVFYGLFSRGRPVVGVLDVEGEEPWRWIGTLSPDGAIAPEGAGVLIAPDSSYVGSVQDGVYSGTGVVLNEADQVVMAGQFQDGQPDGWSAVVLERVGREGTPRSMFVGALTDGELEHGAYLRRRMKPRSDTPVGMVRIGRLSGGSWSDYGMESLGFTNGSAQSVSHTYAAFSPGKSFQEDIIGKSSGPAILQVPGQPWTEGWCYYPKGCKTQAEWDALAQQQAENREALFQVAQSSAFGLGAAIGGSIAGMETADAVMLGTAMGVDHLTGGTELTNAVVADLAARNELQATSPAATAAPSSTTSQATSSWQSIAAAQQTSAAACPPGMVQDPGSTSSERPTYPEPTFPDGVQVETLNLTVDEWLSRTISGGGEANVLDPEAVVTPAPAPPPPSATTAAPRCVPASSVSGYEGYGLTPPPPDEGTQAIINDWPLDCPPYSDRGGLYPQQRFQCMGASIYACSAASRSAEMVSEICNNLQLMDGADAQCPPCDGE